MNLAQPIETSFGNPSSSSSSSYPERPKTSVKQLCSDLFQILVRYETVLTIKQLFDIRKHLCNRYSLRHFSEFGFTNDDDDDCIPLDMLTFLYLYREKIDPTGNLSIYDTASSTGDRQDIYLFVNQLSILNSWREKQEANENSSSRDIPLSKDQTSAVEKAIQYRFGGALTNNHRASQVIKKANNHYSKKAPSLIR